MGIESSSYVPEEVLASEVKRDEVPLSYDVAVALAAGWKYAPDDARFKDSLELGLESKMRTLAVGELAEEGRVQKIIFSGGRLFGKKQPLSEGMAEYFKKKYPDLNVEVELESDSVDTTENAENVAAILSDEGINTAIILTSQSHLKRAQKLFERQGIEAYPIEAEYELAKRSSHHERFCEQYLGSCHNLKNNTQELILRGVMVVDKDGRYIKKIAHRQRDDQE